MLHSTPISVGIVMPYSLNVLKTSVHRVIHSVYRMVAEIAHSVSVGYGVSVRGFESHQVQDVEAGMRPTQNRIRWVHGFFRG
jgi:hypothetical protein